MTSRWTNALTTLTTALLLALAACGPERGRSDPAGTPAQDRPPAAEKKLITIAIQGEPPSFDAVITGASASPTAAGLANVPRIAHDFLTVQVGTGGTGIYEPRLASEMPSPDKGTWQVNPDGTMDMTWKLRPNIKWHDGAPFTSGDLLFTFQVRRDRDIVQVSAGGGRPDLMVSATAPDPLTFAVHWSQVYVRATEASDLQPLPEHLLGDLYRNDKAALPLSRYFTTEFMGTGAFRLEKWDQGSSMRFARFEDYYLSRPPLDRVVVRFIPDSNTMVANILSGAVDVVLPRGVDIEAALEVQHMWEGTGNQVRVDIQTSLEQLEMQVQPAYARPVAGWANRRVRQAFYHAIDRPSLGDVMTRRLAPIADSWYSPDDPARKDVEAYIPQFPFDPSRALSLLASEGWVRNVDGVLAHHPDGERFASELMIRPGAGPLRQAQIITDNWKAIGAQVDIEVLTGAVLNDAQHLATRVGPSMITASGFNFYDRKLHSLSIPRAETRWTGNRADTATRGSMPSSTNWRPPSTRAGGPPCTGISSRKRWQISR